VTRICQRLGLKEDTVWSRLRELRAVRRPAEREPAKNKNAEDAAAEDSKVKAAVIELDLMRVLLADPTLVSVAQVEIDPRMIEHPRLRLLLEVLYRLAAEGEVPDLDHARLRIDNPALFAKALELQEMGRMHSDRQGWLRQIVACFRQRQERPVKAQIQHQLRGIDNAEEAKELLRQLQKQTA
jgi:DNA primase